MDAIWEDEEVLKRIRAVVKDNIGLFDQFADIEKADIVQDLLIEIREALPTFKPGPGMRSFGGWVSMVAHRRLLNKARNRGRRATWDGNYAEIHRGKVDTLKVEEGVAECDLVDWLGEVYRRASRLMRGPQHTERRTFEASQMIAVAALMRMRKLSSRGAQTLFVERKDLAQVVGFTERVPSQRWFCRALGADDSLSPKNN